MSGTLATEGLCHRQPLLYISEIIITATKPPAQKGKRDHEWVIHQRRNINGKYVHF